MSIDLLIQKVEFWTQHTNYGSVMCANFLDRRSRDRELRHKKNRRQRRFCGPKFINSPITQKPHGVQAEIWHNMGANGGFMRAEFGGAWSRDWNFKAENRKEVDKFVLVYLGKYGIDEKMFVILNTLSTPFF